jgi:hypothetical protein
MNERLVAFTPNISTPVEGSAVSQSATFIPIPFGATLIYASVSPFNDDTGAVMDIQIDTVDIVTGIDASDHDVPGEWASVHAGGTNAPIRIPAGSMLELDFDAGAAANRFDVTLLFLTGETWG